MCLLVENTTFLFPPYIVPFFFSFFFIYIYFISLLIVLLSCSINSLIETYSVTCFNP